MSVISIASNNDNVIVTPSGNNNQIGVSLLANSGNFVTAVTDSTAVTTLSTDPTIYNISLLSGSTGIVSVVSEPNIVNTVVTINQGQQGPPGASGQNGTISVLNYANNRIVTALDAQDEINAESNLTFDGSILGVSGNVIVQGTGNFGSGLYVNSVPVSITGHTHTASNITNFNAAVSGLLTPYQLLLTNPVTGTGSVNHIAYWNSSSGISADNGQLYWDSTNNRLGIGTSSPSGSLHVNDFYASDGIVNLIDIADFSGPAGSISWHNIYNDLGDIASIQVLTDDVANKGILTFDTNNGTSLIERLRITSEGYIGIGTSSPTSSLHVIGTGRFSSALFVGSVAVSLSGHTHTSSDITNFNSSVSGLLPTISNSGNNKILTSTGTSVGINAENNLTFDGTFLSVNGSGNFASGLTVNNNPVWHSGNFDTTNIVRTTGNYTINGSWVFTDYMTFEYPTFYPDLGASIGDVHYLELYGPATLLGSNISVFMPTEGGQLALDHRNMIAGSGLTGGGTIAGDRTFNVGAGDGISVGADSISVDSTVIRTTGNQNIGGNLIVGGDLTVNGTTVTTNVDTITIKDPILTLGLASGNIVTNDSLDRGLALVIGTGLTAFIGWDSSASEFVMLGSGVATNNSGNYDAGSYGNLRINNLIANSGSFNVLQINGTGVSISGHTHSSSDITNFNSSVDDRITLALSGIPEIVDKCNTNYILIKDNINDIKKITLTNFINIIDEIDGGGVISTGCP